MPKTIQFTTLRALNRADNGFDAAVVAVTPSTGSAHGVILIRMADLPIAKIVLFDLILEFGYKQIQMDSRLNLAAYTATGSNAERDAAKAWCEFKDTCDSYYPYAPTARYAAGYPATEDDLLEVLANYGTYAEAVDKQAQREMCSDPVNSPSHYRMQVFDACGIPRDIEALEITDSLLKDVPEWVSFSTAACYKEALTYLLRMWKKGAPIQDAEKAVFYLLRMINRLNTMDDLPK